MTNSPTTAHVTNFWAAMQAHYATRVIDKSNAAEMRLAAAFLERIHVLDAASFMERFTTIIGRRIYAPFTPGIATPRHSLWSQIVVCTHEHQHVEQHDREGKIRFSSRYLLSPAARAAYEAEAYCCNLELHYWHTGEIPDTRELADRLMHYGVRKRDIEAAHQTLSQAARKIQAGQSITLAAQRAIDWLQQNAPELQHRPVSHAL